MFLPIPLQLRDGRRFDEIPVANGLLVVVSVLFYFMGWTLAVGPGTGLFSVVMYAFGHVTAWHLIGNVWVLLVFGTPLNRRLGNFWYCMFYFGCTIALGVLARMFLPALIVGSSGSVFAVIAGALLLLPSARLEIFYVALFPFTLLVGLFVRPAHWVFWFVRWDRFSLRAIWALVLVPLLELWSLIWSGWNWVNLGHLMGLLLGVIAVLLLPERLTMRRSTRSVFSTN